MKSSNIKFTSNIFPVETESIENDRDFKKQIRGQEALKKIAEIIHGRVGNDEMLKRYLCDIVEPWQIELYWDLSLPCIYSNGERPFGIVKKGNREQIECRCEITSCNRSRQCRSNKEVGS